MRTLTIKIWYHDVSRIMVTAHVSQHLSQYIINVQNCEWTSIRHFIRGKNRVQLTVNPRFSNRPTQQILARWPVPVTSLPSSRRHHSLRIQPCLKGSVALGYDFRKGGQLSTFETTVGMDPEGL